jgi:hypothetical protein
MVSYDAEYNYVSGQISLKNEKMESHFKFFIKSLSAIIGGSVWLRLQDSYSSLDTSKLVILSDVVVVGLAFFTCVGIAENFRSWFEYRQAQCRIAGADNSGAPRIPQPRVFRSAVLETAMALLVTTAAALYCAYNPFSL